MKKKIVLFIDFLEREKTVYKNHFDKLAIKSDTLFIDLVDIASKQHDLTNVSLVLLRLNDTEQSPEEKLSQVNNHFALRPIILVKDDIVEDSDLTLLEAKNCFDIRSSEPSLLIAKSIQREITRQHHKQLQHQLSSQLKNETYRFKAFLKHTEDGVALIHNGKYLSSNTAYKRIFGIEQHEDLSGKPVLEFSSDFKIKDKDTNADTLNASLDALPDETVISVLIQNRENQDIITTIYKTHCFVGEMLCTQVLIHNPDAWINVDKGFTDLRTYDIETGLYNKRFFTERLEKEFHSEQPQGSLAYILIDDYRSLRDQHDIDYIENLIKSISDIISQSSPDNEILTRYGECIFTLFSNDASRSDFLKRCQLLLTDVNEQLFGDDSQYINLSLSIGVSFIDNRISSVKELISQADKACEKAAAEDGNQIHVYDSISTPLTAIVDEEKNRKMILSALEQNRLFPLYQPIVDLSEKSTENYAVLLRILDEKNLHIPPDQFILTAEKTGLISSLDEWVVKNTIQQIREATRQGIRRKFFITLSPSTYRTNQFLETLQSDLKFYNVDPNLLVFQVKFSDLKTNNSALKNFIQVVKSCGCQIAFDHIGFGNMTSQTLKEFPVDYIKIDGSFSQNLMTDQSAREVIQSLIELSEKHHIRTIAKSVEDANTLALLWNLGVDAVQGYFLQRPSDHMQFDFDLND